MKGKTFSAYALAGVVLLALSACDARPQSEMTGRSLLEMFSEDGPQVSTVSDSLLGSARQAEEAKDYMRALQFYKQLSDKQPNNLDYLLGVAENQRRSNQLDDAIKSYDQILRRNPHAINALEGKGLSLISKTEFPAASQMLERVMMSDGTRWRTLNGVGLLFVAKGMPREALSYFNSALQRQPEHPSILNNIGLTLALQQDYSRAAQALIRASGKTKSKSEERIRVDLNLALVLGLAGDVKQAEQVAGRHLSDSALQNNLGFYAYLADNEGLAKAYLNSALSGSPTFYEKAWENLETVGKN